MGWNELEGIIEGTPRAPGVYACILSATGDRGARAEIPVVFTTVGGGATALKILPGDCGTAVNHTSITQPANNATLLAGVAYTFAAVADDATKALWMFHDGTVNSVGYTVTHTFASPGNYTVNFAATCTSIYNAGGASIAVNVVAPQPPVISLQPANATVNLGQAATFSVQAAGTAALNYQWYCNGSATPGATASNYTTRATTTGDNGNTYYVVVGNVAGSVQSSTATLRVVSPPAIGYSPSAQSISVGSPITTWVPSNAGGAPASWSISPALPSGVALNGSTGAIGGTPTVVLGTTTFTVTAQNAAGTSTANLSLTVTPVPPAITQQPNSQSVIVLSSATFSVAASGTAPLSYQWWKIPQGGSAAAISGATSASYTTPPASALEDGSAYYAVVMNAAGGAQSAGATLSVRTPTLVISPASPSVPTGGTVAFSATQDGASVADATWSVVESGGGSINASGIYTAPSSRLGTFTIQAVRQGNAQILGQTSVKIIPRGCR